MFKSLFVFFLTMALCPSLGLAGQQPVPGRDGKGQPGQPLTQITLDELKDRCINWEKYPEQRQPQNIKVTCTDITNDFVATAPGSVDLDGARKVLTGVTSHKWEVLPSETDLPIYQKAGSCLRFKEIQKTTTVERALSCDELVGMKGTLEQFCIDTLNMAKGANPKLTQIVDTGKVIDTCDGIAYKDGGGKGGGTTGRK